MWYNIATTDHLTAHSILISVLTVLPIGYSVIVALTGLPIGYSVIIAITIVFVNKIISNHSHIPSWKICGWWALYM